MSTLTENAGNLVIPIGASTYTATRNEAGAHERMVGRYRSRYLSEIAPTSQWDRSQLAFYTDDMFAADALHGLVATMKLDGVAQETIVEAACAVVQWQTGSLVNAQKRWTAKVPTA